MAGQNQVFRQVGSCVTALGAVDRLHRQGFAANFLVAHRIKFEFGTNWEKSHQREGGKEVQHNANNSTVQHG